MLIAWVSSAELLDIYREAVLQLERRLVQLPVPPLLSLQHFMADFEVLLPEVASVVGEVQRMDLKGCQITRTLERKAQSGVPAVQSCAHRLLWHCRQILFKQLDSWLVHGLLLDPGNEFFIKRSAQATTAGPAAAAGVPSWHPLEWHDGFYIDTAALTQEITLPTAHAAMFIGKAVRALRQPMAAAASEEAARAHSQILSFSGTLRDLQRQDLLRPVALEHAVEVMRSAVATLLWDLVRRQCDLAGRLGVLHSYFLLGKGDLYQQFLQGAAPLLACAPRPATAAADIALAFKQAAAQGSAAADPLSASVSLGWDALPSAPPQASAVHVPSYDAWDGLHLRCNVDWPLQLLFPPEVMHKYSTLWQYIFRLKRLQLDLEAVWASLQALGRPARHGRGGGSTPAVPPALRRQLGQLRQRMAHFAANLTLYVQLDVVEAATATLRGRIAAAADFSDADAAHRSFADSLVTHAFLDVRQLMGMVEGMFAACRRLCSLARDLEQGQVEAADAVAVAEEVAHDFRVKHNLLFQLMQSGKLQSQQRAPGLRQLVLRLNFNEFCEREMLQHLHVTPPGLP